MKKLVELLKYLGYAKQYTRNNRDYGTNRDRADLKTCVNLLTSILPGALVPEILNTRTNS